MATVSKTISKRVHGSGVANCGSYPQITANFTITFTRDSGSDLVTWATTGMGNWGHNTSGKFGYRFRCYIRVNDGSYETIIDKNNTTADYWWNHTSINNRSGSFTSTSNTTTVKIYVKGKDNCMSGGNYCFRTTTYTQIASYTIDLPPYEANFTVGYNANGGQGAPASQTKSNLEDLVLSSTVPSYPLNLNYYNGSSSSTPSDVEIANRLFLSWNTAQDGTGTTYSPGDTYSTNASCTLYAQWGDATFEPIAMPTRYVTLTLDTDGGVVDPSSLALQLQALGYGTTAAGTTYPYVPGTSYTTTVGLDLYPKYGPATIQASDIPVPSKIGCAFEGWFADPELTQPITTTFSTMTDATIYAKWRPLPIHQFDGTIWTDLPVFIWRFNGIEWQKVAPIYRFDGIQWINMSGDPESVEVTTAKAGIANFITSLARPLVNLTAYFNATQEAGTPTPQSPKAISGVSAVGVYHRGFNLFDKTTVIDGEYINDTDGTARTDANSKRSDFIEITPDTNYYTKSEQTQGNWGAWYDENKNFISGINGYNAVRHSPVNARFARLTCYRGGSGNIDTFCFNVSDASKNGQYEAYNNASSTTLINLGGTYYGGYVTQDKSGKRELVVTSVKKKLSDYAWIKGDINTANTGRIWYKDFNSDAEITMTNTALCNSFEFVNNAWDNLGLYQYNARTRYFIFVVEDNYSTSAQMLEDYGDVEFTAILKTPFTVALPDGEPIIALNGVNNIYNNSSDSQVTFLATPQEAEAAQQRSLSKGSPSEEPEEEEKPEEEFIEEEPKDTGNER